jgi:hypothetical protein
VLLVADSTNTRCVLHATYSGASATVRYEEHCEFRDTASVIGCTNTAFAATDTATNAAVAVAGTRKSVSITSH